MRPDRGRKNNVLDSGCSPHRVAWGAISFLFIVAWVLIARHQAQIEYQVAAPPSSAIVTACKPSNSLPLGEEGFSMRTFMREAFAQFVSDASLTDKDVARYFYGARPTLDLNSSASLRSSLERGLWFRLPGCDDQDLDPPPPKLTDRGKLLELSAMAMRSTQPPEEVCLFSQMRPSKNVAIIALARKLNVTHVIESGRKGGVSALVYALFGFKVTSIELYPMPPIAGALAQLAPEITLRDGDGAVLVGETVSQIRKQHPGARIAVILDGPKYMAAYEVFKSIRSDVVFAVFDDTYPETEFRTKLTELEKAVFYSDNPTWTATLMPALDKTKLAEGWPADDKEPAEQFAEEWQAMAIVAGGSWRQWE